MGIIVRSARRLCFETEQGCGPSGLKVKKHKSSLFKTNWHTMILLSLCEQIPGVSECHQTYVWPSYRDGLKDRAGVSEWSREYPQAGRTGGQTEWDGDQPILCSHRRSLRYSSATQNTAITHGVILPDSSRKSCKSVFFLGGGLLRKARVRFGKHNDGPPLSTFFVPLIHVFMSLGK